MRGMNDEPILLPAPAPRPSGNWLAPTLAIVASVAAASAMYYGYTVQQRTNEKILQQLAALQTAQRAAPAVTSEQLAAVQSIPAMIQTIDKIPTEITAQSTQMNEQFTAITTRLDALEKPTAPLSKSSARDGKLLQQFLTLKLSLERGLAFADPLAALTLHPEISEAMTPIANMAETGIKTEASLRMQLRTLLDNYHEKNPAEQTAAPHSLVSRLNSQFDGMMHISKRTGAPDDTVALLTTSIEMNAPISVLSQQVQKLSPATQPYFAAWLSAAAARQKADVIMLQIEAALADPASAQ